MSLKRFGDIKVEIMILIKWDKIRSIKNDMWETLNMYTVC